MADRDKYGNYVNNKGVTIKITTDKKGNYKAAYNRYKNSVLVLEEQYARQVLISRFVKTIKLQTNN